MAGKITIYCWNLEGWDNVVLLYQYDNTYDNTNVPVEAKNAKGEKAPMHNYYPQLYRFEVPLEYNMRICFSKDGKANTFGTNLCSPVISNASIATNRYYTNADASFNQILGPAIKEPASDRWRIAIRQLWTNKKHYIYNWGGTEQSSSATSKEMTPLLGGKYYYYDLKNDASGFLFNDGQFNSGSSKGHQTGDLNATKYKEGKLMNDWYGTISITN